MRIKFLSVLSCLAMAGCMTPMVGDPLTGAALEARLSGQNLALTVTDPSIGTPVNIRLYPDYRVDLTYADGEIQTTQWRVDGQGLCFAGRVETNRFYCRNIVIGREGSHFTVYDTRSSASDRLASGVLSPI